MRTLRLPRVPAVLALALSLLAAAAASPRPAAAAAEEYPIKFERPYKVGDAFRVTSTATDRSDRSTALAGQPPQVDKSVVTVALAGDVKVLAVTDKGRPTKIACTIATFEVTEAGTPAARPLQAGQVVVLDRTGKDEAITLEGGHLPDGVGEHVKKVLNVTHPQSPGEDESFGTPDRKKVGDGWDVHADAMIASAALENIPLAKDGVAGRVTLSEVRAVDGVPCGVFDLTMKAAGEKGAKHPKLPDGITIAELTMTMSGRKVLPMDPALHTVSESTGTTMNMTVGGQPAGAPGQITVTLKLSRTKESRWEPKK